MQVQTRVKAGGYPINHNQALVQAPKPVPRPKIKTGVKGGSLTQNHNQTLVVATHKHRGVCAQTSPWPRS